MSIENQSDKELADAGRMLMAQINPIVAELERRGYKVSLQGYYDSSSFDRHYYKFQAKRVKETSI